jgi:hypothetical protein
LGIVRSGLSRVPGDHFKIFLRIGPAQNLGEGNS